MPPFAFGVATVADADDGAAAPRVLVCGICGAPGCCGCWRYCCGGGGMDLLDGGCDAYDAVGGAVCCWCCGCRGDPADHES